MPNLAGLKIHSAPLALKHFAEQHNALVDLISSMEGALGLDVQITHRPKPLAHAKSRQKSKVKDNVRGKILLTLNPTALQGVQQPASGGGTTSELHFNDGATKIDVDGTVQGIKSELVLFPGNYGLLNTDQVYIVNTGVGNAYLSASGLFIAKNGGLTFSIDVSALTQNMGIKTISVCNSGSPASMLVLGSDPF